MLTYGITHTISRIYTGNSRSNMEYKISIHITPAMPVQIWNVRYKFIYLHQNCPFKYGISDINSYIYTSNARSNVMYLFHIIVYRPDSSSRLSDMRLSTSHWLRTYVRRFPSSFILLFSSVTSKRYLIQRIIEYHISFLRYHRTTA